MSLTTDQQQVLAALAGGCTQIAAAAAAGVHRNTIAYWRQNSPEFRVALTQSIYDRTLVTREKAEAHVDSAIATITAIMLDPDVTPNASLRAAQIILDKAWARLPDAPEAFLEPDATVHQDSAPAAAPTPVNVTPHATVHTPPQPKIVHSFAQSENVTLRREGPKIGRNETCPCGSGMKFKRCCIDKGTFNQLAA